MKSKTFIAGASTFFFFAWMIGCGGRELIEIVASNDAGSSASNSPNPSASTQAVGQTSTDDAGANPPDPTSLPQPNTTCLPDSGPIVTCSVSFQADILAPMFSADGTLGCAKSQCHSQESGVEPII